MGAWNPLIRIGTLIAPLAAYTLACVSVSKNILQDAAIGPPVSPDSVHIFLEDDTVPERCQRVALLHGKGTGFGVGKKSVIEKLQQEAGELGADAIQLRGFGDVENIFGGDVAAKGTVLALNCRGSSYTDIARRGEVVEGMSAEQVVLAWGEPDDKRTRYSKNNEESWYYEARQARLWFVDGILKKLEIASK